MYKTKRKENRNNKSTKNNKRRSFRKSGNSDSSSSARSHSNSSDRAGKRSFSNKKSNGNNKNGNRNRYSSRGSGSGRLDLSKYTNPGIESAEEVKYQNEFTFEDFNLDPKLQKRIREKGYLAPTEIQDKSIPYTLMGHDLIGIAGTGTGKTAAFLVPIIQRILESKNQQYNALIITPTRELASQIMDEFFTLTKGMKLFSTALIGGTSIDRCLKSLGKTNHIIVGTPGRLMDMVRRKALHLHKFETLVLDEFDRMLDMGFKDDVLMLENGMENKRRTLMFSATMDHSQREIINNITEEPVEVFVKTSKKNLNSVKQDVIHVKRGESKQAIIEKLIGETEEKVILFCETKQHVDAVHKKFGEVNIKSDIIHGDKSQREREKALRKFKKGHTNVLVATDVLARGIDIDDVSLVINYEVPRNYNDYIHRIGRTGRAGKSGQAITLINK